MPIRFFQIFTYLFFRILERSETNTNATKKKKDKNDEENENSAVLTRKRKRSDATSMSTNEFSYEDTLRLVVSVEMFGTNNWTKVKSHWSSYFSKYTLEQLKNAYECIATNQIELNTYKKKGKELLSLIKN